MAYRRSNIANITPEGVHEWADKEFQQIEREFALQDFLVLKQLYIEPIKPRDGMVVLADGTTWNPGTGQGVYAYYAGAWHKLG